MKTLLLLLFPALLCAQTEKGATPLNPQSEFHTPQSTRAVIVGISDYQDPAIPDLQFAHRDAEAFAEWLRSPAGGCVPDTLINVLLNNAATCGKFIAALDGLIAASKPGDEAIVYFSGHGDVERVTKFQRGYWLTWDSPPAVYGAGAFSLQYLQDIITTLSDMDVQVVVVSDACRSGKLAGSEFGGTQATTAALARQFANEIKVLSCQPEEFSLEGKQWGGGRGVFSYHLVDALYGMADGNADGTVSLMELGRYLEEKVPAEAAPHRQIPLTLGNRATHLATVDAGSLADWRQNKAAQELIVSKTDSKGIEQWILAKADTSIEELYAAFNAALEQGKLMPTDSTAGQSANDYYERLIKEPSIAGLHGVMTRNFAAALMDEGQQVINHLLKTDPATISDVWAKPVKFDHIPDLLYRAAELLGERHYVYKSLKAKEYYFLEKKMRKENHPDLPLDSINNLKLDLLRQGLSFDSTAAFLWESHSKIQWASPDLEPYLKKALDYSPNWALAHFELANWNSFPMQDYRAAVEHFKKCIELAPDFTAAYNWISWPLDAIGAPEEADKYRTLFVEKIREKWAKDSSVVSALELNDMGNALWRLHRYRESIAVSEKAITMTQGNFPNPFGNLLVALADLGRFEAYATTFEACCMETHSSWFVTLGDFYLFYFQDSVRATYWYDKALQSNDAFPNSPLSLATLISLAASYRLIGRPQKALEILFLLNCQSTDCLFEKAESLSACGREQEALLIFDTLSVRAEPVYLKAEIGANLDFVYQCIAFHRLGRQEAFEASLRRALEQPDEWGYYWLACIYAQTGRPKNAVEYLALAEQNGWYPNPVNWIGGTVKDPLLDPLRHLPEFQAWEKRWSPPYKDYSKD